MTIRPGRNLIWAAAVAGALSPLTFAWPSVLWALLAAAIPVAWLAVSDYRAISSQFASLRVSRDLPGVIGRGVCFTSELRIHNKAAQPAEGLLRDVVPPDAEPHFQQHHVRVSGGDEEAVAAELRIPRRGWHEFGPVWLRHVVLFAALRTPALAELVHAPVQTLLDGSRKAVAFRLLRERERAVHSIHRSGVHVVDVEPEQLTVPLINQFIELRQRNLL